MRTILRWLAELLDGRDAVQEAREQTTSRYLTINGDRQ